MENLHIEFQPNIKEKLFEFLNSFSKNELKIVEESLKENENNIFIEHKKRLQLSLDKIILGESKFYDIEELDAMLEKTISKNED